MKPKLSEVLKILQLQEQATKIYEEIDQQVAELFLMYDTERCDYDLSDIQAINAEVSEFPVAAKLIKFANEKAENGHYLKFQIINNLENMRENGTVFKTTSIKAITFSSGNLKRCPESLKEL